MIFQVGLSILVYTSTLVHGKPVAWLKSSCLEYFSVTTRSLMSHDPRSSGIESRNGNLAWKFPFRGSRVESLKVRNF
jgi:hypothetical protein